MKEESERQRDMTEIKKDTGTEMDTQTGRDQKKTHRDRDREGEMETKRDTQGDK